MGREIKRVPLDYDFPLGASVADAAWEKHAATCALADHDECDSDWRDDVPKGEGWQLWQTVSDGPISPVFATPEALIDFMSQPAPRDDKERWRVHEDYPSMPWAQGWRRETAERFVRAGGSMPSFISRPGHVLSTNEMVDELTRKRSP